MNRQNQDHNAIWELLPEYALGILDADETAAVEAHLPGCPEYRAELHSLRAVTTGMALALDPALEPAGHQARFAQKLEQRDPVAVPPGHRDRFLQKLEAESGQPLPAPPHLDGDGDVQARQVVPEPAQLPTQLPTERPQLQVIRNPQAEPAIRTWSGWAAAGALAAALILAILWGSGQRDGATRQAAAAQATAAAAQTQVAVAQAEATAATQALAVIASPAGKVATLAGNGDWQRAQVQVWMDPASGAMVLHAEGLPPAPTGRQYELWLLRGQTPVAVDLFQPAGAGSATQVFPLPPGTPTDYTAAALTIETRRETAPTSAPVLAGGF